MTVETSNIIQAPQIVDDSAIHKPFVIDHVMVLRQAYEQQRYDIVVDHLVVFLKWLKQQRTEPFDQQEVQLLSVMLKMITIILRDPNISIPAQHLEEVISSSEIFGKAHALCNLPPPDETLIELLKNPKKLPEALLCLSTHTRVDVELKPLVEQSPIPLSLWWSCMIREARPALEPHRNKRLKTWISDATMLDKYHYVSDVKPTNMIGGLFDVTYIDDSIQRQVKSKINDGIDLYLKLGLTKHPTLQDIKEDRNEHTILVISEHFRLQHAVYRSLSPLLYSLKDHYRLAFMTQEETLATNSGRGVDRDLFDDIYSCDTIQSLCTKVAQEIKPSIVLFPDIGMSLLSILCSNLRLAPIQCMAYGHPVSSFAREVDYFIGSADAEDHALVNEHYSEKAVLIPGLAAMPVLPHCDISHSELKENPIRISLAWGNPKMNRSYLEALKPILEQTDTLCHFYISGTYFTNLHYLTIQKELEELFPPERFRLMRQLKADQYFLFIEQCHFGIDSYHFGGYNRIIDSLYCGRPMLVLEGDKIYNRAGATLLRQLGLDELVASNEQELIEKSVRLVDDHAYRSDITKHIQSLDLLTTLEKKNPAIGFRHAIDTMIADYKAGGLSDHTPIIIGSDIAKKQKVG